MFTSVRDRNTRVVYEWVNESGDRVLVPREMWKPVEEWSTDEIEAMFSNANIEPVEEAEAEVPAKGFFGA